jgi:hypothetical protein
VCECECESVAVCVLIVSAANSVLCSLAWFISSNGANKVDRAGVCFFPQWLPMAGLLWVLGQVRNVGFSKDEYISHTHTNKTTKTQGKRMQALGTENLQRAKSSG